MTTIAAAMSGVPFTLLSAVTTGTSVALAIPPSFKHHSIEIAAASGVTAGAIQVETNNNPDDTGTWSQVGGGPITVVAATKVQYNFEGILNFIRARVTTTISGGAGPSATVIYNGAKSY